MGDKMSNSFIFSSQTVDFHKRISSRCPTLQISVKFQDCTWTATRSSLRNSRYPDLSVCIHDFTVYRIKELKKLSLIMLFYCRYSRQVRRCESSFGLRTTGHLARRRKSLNNKSGANPLQPLDILFFVIPYICKKLSPR